MNGAWEAGVIYGLSHFSGTDAPTDEDLAYDVVSGISAGAINAAALALWPPGQEREAAEFVSETWSNITSEDFYKSDMTSWVKALWHQSVYDTSPALDLIQGIL